MKVHARRSGYVEQPNDHADIEDAKNMWRPSPSPSETFSDADGADSDGGWPLKIVSEQVTHYGDIK